jgi:glycosyltransferase involved in cell wall biosynthesis
LKKNLILITDIYPIGLGEFFLDDEMKIAEQFFEKIIVIVPKEQYQSFYHYTSPNMIVHQWSFKRDIKTIWNSFPFILSFETIGEIFRTRKRTTIKNRLKIVVNDALKSSYLMNEVKNILLQEKINPIECIFYSYWHDYKALALARLKQKINGKFISRAHSSDIFAFRSSLNYLPFKRFILSNLHQTYSISEIGRKELETYLETNDYTKVTVSMLGKYNERKPLFERKDDKVIICSCSHFNHLKRVHLIPRILKKVNIPNIHWVHFGWGIGDINERMVYDELKDVNFTYELKGKTPNELVYQYYFSNFVDLFINVSSHEGIPVSIMEAFSAGIPVMATNVGAVTEIVDSECGFIIDIDFDEEEISKLLDDFFSLSKNEITNFRVQAYDKWQNHFNSETNYTLFYQHILNKNLNL